MNQVPTQLAYPELTMYEVVAENAVKTPQEPAYDFYGKKTDYRTFIDKVDQAAGAFSKAGISMGDAVTICMPNTPQAIVCFYALSRIGAIANMIHPLSAQNEITFYLNLSRSKMILTVDLFAEKVKTAIAQSDHPVTLLIARMQDELPALMGAVFTLTKGRKVLKYPDGPGQLLWRKFVAGGRAEDAAKADFDPKRTAVILYSGGTSGTPKGICLSDLNMNALGMQCRSQIREHFGTGITMLSCMPMFHGFGLGVNIHTVLMYGAQCLLMPNFSLKNYAKMLAKKRPNYIAGVPTIYEALLHMPMLDGVKLDCLKGAFCGGDSLSVELKKKVDAFLHEHGASIQVQEGYGLTECVTASCLTPPDDYREGSIGLPYPDTLYDIVKPGTCERLPRGQEGEIILSGPTVMLGYLDNPEETGKTLRTLEDGRIWLFTGDLGRMDEDGFVYFSQRIKRMIITNGYNVYPGRLENVIDGNPHVAYSCVIGVRDARRGQKVRAYVVPQDQELAQMQCDADGNISEDEHTAALQEEILKELKLHVAGYAIPREFVFRKELPKTLVGKVAFRLLEEEANRGEERKKQGEVGVRGQEMEALEEQQKAQQTQEARRA